MKRRALVRSTGPAADATARPARLHGRVPLVENRHDPTNLVGLSAKPRPTV